MFQPLVSDDDELESQTQHAQLQSASASSSSSASHDGGAIMPAASGRDARQLSAVGLDLASLRGGSVGSGSASRSRSITDDSNLSGSLISSEHPSEAMQHGSDDVVATAALSAPASPGGGNGGGLLSGGLSGLTFESLSQKLRLMLMEDASETVEEEIEMMDYDNPEDHVLERKLDEDHHPAAHGAMAGSHSAQGGENMGASGLGMAGLRQPGSRMGSWGASFARRLASRNWRKLKLTLLRMFITIVIGICIGLTGFAVSRSVTAMVHANLALLSDMMGKDRPAAAFFTILLLSCIYTGVASLFVTFGSWQTRGSGVGRLNAYLSGMSSSRFLALKTLFVKIGGLILTVSAGIKQGMEGPFIHIGAMVGLHVSRLLIWVFNLIGGRWGIRKYTGIVSGVVDERMFISSGAAAGFSVAFNAPIAGVLYVQDGAFAYWQGEYTLRTFLCTMTAVTTINMCFKSGEELPSRGLIDIDFARTTIVLSEFWGFVILGIMGGLMGIVFTRLNVAVEKFRHKYLGKARLPNVLDVLACTVLTVLLSFILPFMLGCHSRWAEDSCDDPDRCLQFQCGPQRYSDLATLFFTLPEEAIRILFDRKTSVEAHIPYQTLLLFCVFYFLMVAISYGMAVPGGLFVPSIIIGASYGRLVGLAVQYVLTAHTPAGETPPVIIPGVYAVLGSASMLGGITRMTLPITVMMVEVTSDAQFLIPIMLVVLVAKVVADFGTPALYPEHLKLDGLVMVFGDKPPTALKKLTARDIMSKHTVRKLDVITTVEEAWAAIRDTRHNAFPVTDGEGGTLRSIIQQRRQSISGSSGAGEATRRRSVSGKRGTRMEEVDPVAVSASSSSAAAAPITPASAKGTGVFLGLIQRRHLIYVLTSMPCFPTATAARDSEPLTALPYELQLVAYNLAQEARRGRRLSNSSVSPDAPSRASSSDALETVPLDRSNSGHDGSPISVQLSPVVSSDAALLVVSPPPPTSQPNVSHALMHGSGSTLLNQQGASASASFVEWAARQAQNVGQDLTKVAAGDVLPRSQAGRLTTNSAAQAPEKPSRSKLRGLTPSSSLERLSGMDRASSSDANGSHLTADAAPLTAPHSLGHSHSHFSASPEARAHMAPGADLSVQASMLSHSVNLSPFIDQGAYTVSEDTSARRVWALFRALGMRHIVVLSHAHQPVGVITRRDLIRFAVAQ